MPDLKKIDVAFSNKETTNELKYYDPVTSDKIKVYGLNWFDEDKRYVRFPKYSDEMIKNLADGLYYLVEQPSGAMLAFKSNTSTVKIKVELGNWFSMAHMAFTGQGGFDIYIGTTRENLKFYRTSSFPINNKTYEFTYFCDWEKEERFFLLNFPLYSGVNKIEIGIDSDASITPSCDLFDKGRVVCYGTSITQGGCASRGGMSYTNQLSRRTGYEFLNFGFSGNGRGQKEVAELLASINDVSMFILDYEANATLPMLQDTLDNFINIIRDKYPTVPILVLSKIRMAYETHVKENLEKQMKSKKYQKQVVIKHQKYDKNIYFYDGHKLLGKYVYDATVDGSHPTDLGFMMITENLEKVLKKYIKID